MVLGVECVMEPDYFGTEQVTEEDRAYKGSRFSEVRDALFSIPTKKCGVALASHHCPRMKSPAKAFCAASFHLVSPTCFARPPNERRFPRGFALGPGRQRVSAHSSSERGVSHRPLGDHGTD